MHRILLTAAMLGSLVGAHAVAQQQPDFGGTWTMDMSRSESAAQGKDVAPRRPVAVTITQTPERLAILTETDGRRERVTYWFDGSGPSPQASGTRGTDVPAVENGQSADPVGRARWDGSTLVTVTTYRVNKMAATKTETRSLSNNGREMIVETRLQMEHGYESNGQGSQSNIPTKDVYTK